MLLACGAEVSVNPFEHQLMLRWHKEGKSTAEIAELLQRRDGTVVCRRCIRMYSAFASAASATSFAMDVFWFPMEAPMEAEKTQRY